MADPFECTCTYVLRTYSGAPIVIKIHNIFSTTITVDWKEKSITRWGWLRDASRWKRVCEVAICRPLKIWRCKCKTCKAVLAKGELSKVCQ